jgi:HD-like signal output (HDOD) protein
MANPTPTEVLHQRLKALLIFLKPRLLDGDIDQDRLQQLRRLSDVRIRQFAVGKPQITGLDLCGLLSDPRVGRFDDLADESGIVKKGHLSAVLPTLGEDMGYLVETCLTLQVLGLATMKSHAKGFIEKHGTVAPLAESAPTQPAKPAAAPLAPGVARLLGGLKELWSLSPSTLKALELLRVADSPADLVCSEIERDPGLSAPFLHLVNASPAGLAARVLSVKRAVVTLGYPLARRFVMTAALLSRLGPPYAEAGFDPRAFWLRSLQVAHAAAQIAKATRLGNFDEHYASGLLHSIGRLAVAKAGAASPDAPETEVGAAILERYRFPAAIVESARHHRDSADQLEEIQLPREAMVVAALHSLLGTTDLNTWAGFLRVAADSIPSILEQASKSAQAGLNELSG